MRIINCNTLVVGAGAAGLNAADELKKNGVDVVLACEDFGAGTSINAGSDKQTYYKLSLAGGNMDSVASMARSFYDGGATRGEHALIMAALSVRCFMKLVCLGVPFPHNEFGEYAGYQTDHDTTCRATSAGPLTSKMMAQCLLASVDSRKVRREPGLRLLSILTDPDGRSCGALMHDGTDYAAVNARNVILCTGGPAQVYGNVVYPESQHGATGAAIRAGAAVSNLCYWQYGLASLKVRWNVSGSYQQAVPAYTDGVSEFLLPYFGSRRDMFDSVFLKGYQWPFDARKMTGSSRVDMAVSVLCARGGHAYMDFTAEPDGGVLNTLGEEGLAYLKNCCALKANPFERLAAINQKAVDFYASHDIDLSREPLEVAVCAQHANGGLMIDRWWRTTVDGLYAAGECAGAFGMYRPGGSALNETQVGSLRAAEHITAHTGGLLPRSETEFMNLCKKSILDQLALFDRKGSSCETQKLLARTKRDMDAFAGAMRDVSKMRELFACIDKALGEGVYGGTPCETAIALDTLTVQREALSAMICQASLRGQAGHGFVEPYEDADAPLAADVCVVTRGGVSKPEPIDPLPCGGGWFEEVWKRYLSGEVFE